MGRALPGVDVVLVDPVTGAIGDEGEVCLDLTTRPVNLMTGYLGDEARTTASMRDGLFHTGDVAVRDDDGMITFVGRTDDVFKSSDFKVSPFEVESVLIEHPAVAESAVVPAPDAVRLAVVKAYVTLAAGVEPSAETARAVLAHARTGLPAYERVRRVEFVEELPKTISGKIRRVELRQREEEAARVGERLAGSGATTTSPGSRGSGGAGSAPSSVRCTATRRGALHETRCVARDAVQCPRRGAVPETRCGVRDGVRWPPAGARRASHRVPCAAPRLDAVRCTRRGAVRARSAARAQNAVRCPKGGAVPETRCATRRAVRCPKGGALFETWCGARDAER
nr:hypothetical protein GCM10025699_66260 [Microbacterium flavescens]